MYSGPSTVFDSKFAAYGGPTTVFDSTFGAYGNPHKTVRKGMIIKGVHNPYSPGSRGHAVASNLTSSAVMPPVAATFGNLGDFIFGWLNSKFSAELLAVILRAEFCGDSNRDACIIPQGFRLNLCMPN